MWQSLSQLWFELHRITGSLCPACNQRIPVNRFIGQCEECFTDYIKKAKQERAEQERFDKDYEYKRAAKFLIDALDKRGLIVTHPSQLKGGKNVRI